MRVGEIFWKQEMAPNRTPSQQEVSKPFENRLVTEGSRLVTRPILLVNTRGRKHWISVSGVTRRTFRRAATRVRDDRLRGYESPDLRDEPRTDGSRKQGSLAHPLSGFGRGGTLLLQLRWGAPGQITTDHPPECFRSVSRGNPMATAEFAKRDLKAPSLEFSGNRNARTVHREHGVLVAVGDVNWWLERLGGRKQRSR